MSTTTKQTRSADPLGHPMRRLIRQGLVDNGPDEVADIAEALGEPVSRVAYHVKVLRSAGLVEEAGRRQARGAIATLYRACSPPCGDCGGTGQDPSDGDDCPTCNGSGRAEAPDGLTTTKGDPYSIFDVEEPVLRELDPGELLRRLAASLAGIRGAADATQRITGEETGPLGMLNACDRVEETVREELAAARERAGR